MKYTAEFSAGGREAALYRYALRRDWRDEGGLFTLAAHEPVPMLELNGIGGVPNSQKLVLFIMLNPSTASDQSDDPTISKCMRFARRWGYGGIEVRNLFAFRSPYPAYMKEAKDPIGDRNDMELVHAITGFDIGLVVAAWGNGGQFKDRGQIVRHLLRDHWPEDVYAFAFNKSGEPEHPLYQREDMTVADLVKL
jgi:hypothetical protein